MSNEINDGGPAFPHTPKKRKTDGFYMVDEKKNGGGMTLRDYFAAKAMPEVMVEWRQGREESQDSDFDFDASLMAQDCYLMADAMIEARKGGSK
jgi:hypothetical protein